MPVADERTAMLEAIEKILSRDGWTRRDDIHLPEEVGWSPDRMFIQEDGRKLAIEVEEEVNIPRFIVRRIQTHRELLRDTRVLIASVRNTLLGVSTARTGIENNISIYADVRNPMLVLDSSLPTRISPVSTESVKSAHERFLANKRIPSVLIKHLSDLRHIAYAADLRQFAHDYESVTFDNNEDEHRFVHEFITSRFGDRLKTSALFEGLNTMGLLEEVSEVVQGNRPHFLHSFQTFLLGSVIIDNNYDLFTELYSAMFDTEGTVYMDYPWFFASIFHDVAFPFENIENMKPVSELRETRPRGLSSIYSPHLLGCLFELQRSSTISSEWEPGPNSAAGALCEVLSRYRLNDHGVMGALNLISSSQQMDRRTLATDIYPAALAISLHNSPLWFELLGRGLFPVSAKRFPLVFLLLLCDNIEEWGREMRFLEVEGKSPNALIYDLTFDSHIANFNLWVDEPARAMIIRNRYDWITKRLFVIEDLQLECVFSSSTGS
jgi:hypothetical protein